MNEERKSGFIAGIIFTIFMAIMSVLAYGIVFLPMGWWIK